ncbi:hypothetical protein CEP53_004800 [Fusarium sp. AF-6]|nr:hypothetical protein CEP53_004800 [Fusarium sp. AF-6]
MQLWKTHAFRLHGGRGSPLHEAVHKHLMRWSTNTLPTSAGSKNSPDPHDENQQSHPVMVHEWSVIGVHLSQNPLHLLSVHITEGQTLDLHSHRHTHLGLG